ncbi:hypothetical protein [Actinomadura sp. 6N118]|uniref:hypothetical protein n=1 Tax=Actinomadura sp. 6N118 TaxID=3375151 RepID=UPI0037B3752A
MPKNVLSRALMVGVAASAIVMTAAGTAQAADKTVSNRYGSITHIDNGDSFKVCDTRADGHGVVGQLSDARNIYGEVEDGGDSGCNTFQYNVKAEHPYVMSICWKGPGSLDERCEKANLRE